MFQIGSFSLQKMLKTKNLSWPKDIDDWPMDCNQMISLTQYLHYKARNLSELAQDLNLEDYIKNILEDDIL